MREAISLANGSLVANSITFAAALTNGGPATILLTQDQLDIRGTLTLNGPGANLLTIDASGSDPTPLVDNSDGSPVFRVQNFGLPLFDVGILGLTLTGGDSGGGGILNSERLTLTDCTITGNSGGTSGGGITNDQDLTVVGGTISGNSGRYGGGIVSGGRHDRRHYD